MKEKKCPVCGNEIQFINVPALGIEVKCGKCGGALVVVQCGAVKNQSTRLTQKKIEGRKKKKGNSKKVSSLREENYI
jgi:hypothetical protein